MFNKAFKKNGTLTHRFLMSFKNPSVRTYLLGVSIAELGKKLATRNGSFCKVRAWEASKDGNAFITIGKKGKELATLSYKHGELRKAMSEADYLNQLITHALTPVIVQNATTCPKCGNENVSWDRLETDGDSASQGGFCNKCNCQWATVFKFTHNEILN